MTDRLLLGTDTVEVRSLSAALQAEILGLPIGGDDPWADEDAAALEAWRADVAGGERCATVIVAVWPVSHAPMRLTDQSSAEFTRRAELPFAQWCVALGAASARCEDGGAIVAVAERPSPLDAAGWSAESGIADAVEALVRSLARAEGPRGVRVNAVSTPSRLAPAHPVAPAVPLTGYPGRIDVEVANAVEMLIGPGVGGVTGTVVHVDFGRSWR